MPPPRISRVFGAVNVGSFRISAMIAGLSDTGEMIVLGSGHRAAQGIRRGYVTDMAAATYAVRDAVERAEKMAGVSVSSVWIGCSGAGLASQIAAAVEVAPLYYTELAEKFSSYAFATVARAFGQLHTEGRLWQDPRGRICLKGSKFAAKP